MREHREERLLGRIYDAVFDPTLWVNVMEDLVQELSGEAACMTTLDIMTGEGSGYTALVPEDTMSTYVSRWSRKNPLHEIGDPLSYISDWRPSTIRYEQWVDPETLHRSEFYNEFLRPINSENGLMMGLALVGTTTVTMNIARSSRRDVFDDGEIALARRWQGHLSRAVRLGRELQVGQAALDAMDRLIPADRNRVFFLDGRGRIQRMSAAAERMLCAGADLRVSNGILAAASPADDRELRRLIAQATGRPHVMPSGGAMTLRDPAGASWDVCVAPLGPRGVAAWSVAPIVLVTVKDGAPSALPIELRLRRAFGLTPAETRVTLALMRGGTVRETADAAGVSINTVRAQLATIFSKTGCRRQTDLVRLLMAFR